MSKRIVFFGNERLATGVTSSTPAIRALLDAGYEIAALITPPYSAVSRRSKTSEIIGFAGKHRIPLVDPGAVDGLAAAIKGFGAEAGVLAAYGGLVPEAVIKMFPRGIVNIHPSLLPKHRGSAPIESTIADGDGQTGISLMQLAPELDCGPLYSQVPLGLAGGETKQYLADTLGKLGADELIRCLPGILDGSLTPRPQDEKAANYDSRITSAVSTIDWSKPAVVLEREIRAYAGWPQSRTTLGSVEVIITSAATGPGSGLPGQVSVENNSLSVGTGSGRLIINTLKPAGKNDMPASAFIAGYSDRLAAED